MNSIQLSTLTNDQLSALAIHKQTTTSEALEQAVTDAYARMAEERLIASLSAIDELANKKAALHLMDVCEGNEPKARSVLLAYLQRKHPGYRVSNKKAEFHRAEMRYRGIANQLYLLAKAAETTAAHTR